LQDRVLGRLEDLVNAAEDGEGEDDVLVAAALEGVADQVGDGPDKVVDHSSVLGLASCLGRNACVVLVYSSLGSVQVPWQGGASVPKGHLMGFPLEFR